MCQRCEENSLHNFWHIRLNLLQGQQWVQVKVVPREYINALNKHIRKCRIKLTRKPFFNDKVTNIFIYTNKTQWYMMYMYFFVCSELIEETEQFQKPDFR